MKRIGSSDNYSEFSMRTKQLIYSGNDFDIRETEKSKVETSNHRKKVLNSKVTQLDMHLIARYLCVHMCSAAVVSQIYWPNI